MQPQVDYITITATVHMTSYFKFERYLTLLHYITFQKAFQIATKYLKIEQNFLV